MQPPNREALLVKKKIMIIDDDEDFTSILKTRIEHSGDYDVMATSDAKDVINLIHNFKPDVILLDLLMPGTGGLDVCETLNDDRAGRSIPIIVVSGLDKPADKVKAYKLGISDYLLKPVDTAKLIRAIEKAVGIKTAL